MSSVKFSRGYRGKLLRKLRDGNETKQNLGTQLKTPLTRLQAAGENEINL